VSEFGSESELARLVVGYLQELHYDVYQEVATGLGIGDVIATQGRLVVAVETKLSLTFDVVAQAIRWRQHAHLVYIAVPGVHRNNDGRRVAYAVCKLMGIGVLIVTRRRPGFITSPVSEHVAPAVNRKAADDSLRKMLRAEQKAGEFAQAGAKGGGHFTAFKGTARALASIVREQPGIELAKAIEAIEHHYASPKSARAHLSEWIERGKVPGVRLERDGRKVRLQPAEVKS
jgi:hypothetical protein